MLFYFRKCKLMVYSIANNHIAIIFRHFDIDLCHKAKYMTKF